MTVKQLLTPANDYTHISVEDEEYHEFSSGEAGEVRKDKAISGLVVDSFYSGIRDNVSSLVVIAHKEARKEIEKMSCRNVAREKLNLYIKLHGNPDKAKPRRNFVILAHLLAFATEVGIITDKERWEALEPIKEAAFAAPKEEI